MTTQTEHHQLADSPFRLGEWLVEPRLNRLTRGGETIQLELKVMDVLVCLAERAGEVVLRRDIVDRVWATEFIADNTLTHAITDLRNAFGDDARSPMYIETIHGRGYRLIAPVVVEERASATVTRFPVSKTAAVPTDRSPYPGLAAFTETDAEFFFGREAETAQMWRKITTRRLLAVIGPSGVGKSSFLRAGLIPARPEGWGVLVFQPGEAPFAALARALVPTFGHDMEAVVKLIGLRDAGKTVAMVGRWRQQHSQGLLIVDQFEELLTLSSLDVQASFADLLRRAVDEADVHVLLSMRDDFLFRCHDFESLTPVFDFVTPMKAPTADALRRALVEPARLLGYAFEDDDLPEEMVSEVEGERGALPMLAFAVARLWEQRDRARNLVTRQAYHDIGGVGGALARHAEATIDGIGQDRLPIVRELFRNLVTAEGTRAVREWNELLSVFSDSRSESATAVLRSLIDARLLTSYEVREEEREPTRRVEIIHESLLANWPRLVRWQTQDQEGAQLREELRQAARAWDDHGRQDNRLWTGTAYREFRVWRERYPGRLSELEEAYATSMEIFATRRRRRRRSEVAAVFILLLAVLVVVGIFWRQSTNEARRAEAANLVSLGQLKLDSYPTESLAFAIASLEHADTPAARLLALEALWKGPPALVIDDKPSWMARFTPDANWLVQSLEGQSGLRLIGRDGSSLEFDPPTDWDRTNIWVNPTGEVLYSELWATPTDPQHLVLWSIPEGRKLAEVRYGPPAFVAKLSWKENLALMLVIEGGMGHIDTVSFDGTVRRLGSLDFDFNLGGWFYKTAMDAETGRWLGVIDNDGTVSVIEIGESGISEPRVLGWHKGAGFRTAFHPHGNLFATSNERGVINLWDPSGRSQPRTIQGPPGILVLDFVTDGSSLTAYTIDDDRDIFWEWSTAPGDLKLLRRIDTGPTRAGGYWAWDASGERLARGGAGQAAGMWSVHAPCDADPLVLVRGDVGFIGEPAFHPRGDLLVTPDNTGLAVWPLTQKYSTVIRRHEGAIGSVVFDPSGEWLASAGKEGTIRLWSLGGFAPEPGQTAFERPGFLIDSLAVSPDASTILAGAMTGSAFVVPLNGDSSTFLEGFVQISGVAYSTDGQHAAAAGWGNGDGSAGALYVFEVGDWTAPARFPLEGTISGKSPHYQNDGRIVISGTEGVWRVDPSTGDRELIFEGMAGRLSASRDDQEIALVRWEDYSYSATGQAVLLDLEADSTATLDRHGDKVWDVAIDPAGEFIVTADGDGVIRVGPVTGEEPHLVLGHEGRVWSVAIDPLGRWIASGGEDGTVRLWPMPDLSKPPLHTLPREELIAKLKTLTNLRVVRDPDSATGWKLDVGPFPGWETVPTW